MARIRTIKPEFWEDELLGLLPRDARLLFAATLNLADDEGILRWTPAYIKASAFMYDEDLSMADVTGLMKHLSEAGIVFPFIGGIARQKLAFIVNFRKHQKINRPQPSKLPAPSLQNAEVRRMYARRDGWTCQLCGGGIPRLPVVNDCHNLSIDHIQHQSAGGSDHPSNVRATHQTCNKSRRDNGDEEFRPPISLAGLNDSLNDALSRSMNSSRNDSPQSVADAPELSTQGHIPSVNDSVSSSLLEGKGREGNGGEGKASAKPPRDETPDREDVERICTHLADRIEANGAKRPTINKRWRDAARLMLDADGRAEADVHAAIDWCQDSEFWRANVLSLPKLREKYDQLSLQARRAPGAAVIRIDRRQQQTNDLFDRAMVRAAAREENR